MPTLGPVIHRGVISKWLSMPPTGGKLVTIDADGQVREATAAEIGTAAGLAPIATSGSATDLTLGTVNDARLSSNVPLKNAANTFTGANTFQATQVFESSICVGTGGTGPRIRNNGQLFRFNNNADTARAGIEVGDVTSSGAGVFTDSFTLNTSLLKAGLKVKSSTYAWFSMFEHDVNAAGTNLVNNYIGDSVYAGWKFQNLVGATLTTKAEIKGDGRATFASGVSALDISGNSYQSSSVAFSGNGHLALYSGGQIYLGDNNFRNTSYWNSAPGIGAVGSSPTSELAFYVYTGIVNSRTEAGRFKTNLGLQIGGTGGNILRSSGVSMLVRNSADNAYANIVSQESYVQSFLNVQHPSLGNTQWFRAYTSNGVTTTDYLAVDSANTGAAWRFRRDGGFTLATSGAQINMSTGANTFTTFMGGVGNYEGFQHFQTNGQTNFWVHSTGTISRTTHYLLGDDVNVRAFDSAVSYLRFYGTSKSDCELAGGTTLRFITAGGSRMTVNATAITVVPRIENTNYFTTTSALRMGSVELQPYALNSSIIGDNLYYNGANWTRKQTGFASAVYFVNGEVQLRAYGTGTGTVTNNCQFKVTTTGAIGVGASIAPGPGDLTGANFTVTSTGTVTATGNITATGRLNSGNGTSFGESGVGNSIRGNDLYIISADGGNHGRFTMTSASAGAYLQIGWPTVHGQVSLYSSPISTGNTGYIAWFKPSGARQGYIGYDGGNDITLKLEQAGGQFVVDGIGARIGSSGPLLKNSSGTLQVRNSADNAFANIQGESVLVQSSSDTTKGLLLRNSGATSNNLGQLMIGHPGWHDGQLLMMHDNVVVANMSSAFFIIQKAAQLLAGAAVTGQVSIAGSNSISSGVFLSNTASTLGRTGRVLIGWPGNYDNQLLMYHGSTLFANISDSTINFTRTVGVLNQSGTDTQIVNTNNGNNAINWSSTGAPGTRITALTDMRLAINYVDRVTLTNALFSVIPNATFSGHITSAFQSLSADPSTLDISAGLSRLVKNTTSGEIRWFVNDGGTIKKSAAFT